MIITEDNFCCEVLGKIIEYGSTLGLITKDNLDYNKEYRKFAYGYSTPQHDQELKIGQVWLINDETGEFEGEPFSFCPFCKADIKV